jgi:plastocyanin
VFVIAASPARADMHEVSVASFAFTPPALTISEGDTVRWTWVDGIHTTTSGDPGTCTPDGMWSAPLDAGNPSFEVQFDSAGLFTYFCMPHCSLGMTGEVLVEPAVPVEPTTWGTLKAIYAD